MKARRIIGILTALVMLVCLPAQTAYAAEGDPAIAETEPDLPFTDVTPDSDYYEDILFVYANDIMNGMSSTTFGEDLTLTRGMLVTILHRLEGEPVVNYAMNFTDVEPEAWYTEAIRWAAATGIVNGYGDSLFGPDDDVTREQLAAILYRYANFKGYDTGIGEDTNILSYDDSFEISDWAFPAMQWACGTDVVNSGNTPAIRSAEAATRGEIAHAIRAFLEEVAE